MFHAFNKICVEKMLYDGYCDMSYFVNAQISQEEMLYRLANCKSKYIELYRHPYPSQDVAYKKWYNMFNEEPSSCENMLLEEANAIVYWVYMILSNEEERKQFTLELFSKVKELALIDCSIEYKNGVFYNSKKIELKIISSIAEFNTAMATYQKNDTLLYYRGHSNANYRLQPSISRKNSWLYNEREMYNELLINCPSDFEKCSNHLEKLVKMQHYGLPTRLLDITKNALVALYFSCASHPYNYGEIILISATKDSIYYPQSDTASILASLPAFSYNVQQAYAELARDESITKESFNIHVSRLIHEIRLEKPAFGADIDKSDILKNIIILAVKNNNRIIKQDGAFILCGLSNTPETLNQFRYQRKSKTLILLVSNKKKILEQLSTFSITRATLFPEIECVADYIKNIY